MESIYNEIQYINHLGPATLAERLGKLTEEVGELATAVNKTTGLKRHTNSQEEIRSEMLGEVADSIQNVMSIAADAGFTFDEICQAMVAKNQKWLANVQERM